ncbi:MAG: sulfotransferase, partial [Candidatus Competibacteraceae bacterium]
FDARALLITGIPRSGTSYLCRLLHGVRDAVIINEPRALYRRLNRPDWPRALATLYRDLRADVLAGRPIENKLHGGQVIEDTAVTDRFETYTPRVAAPDFLLGSKNTLGYLARLSAAPDALSGIAVVACVRHPVPTIASWKRTFPHLREAAVDRFAVGARTDPLLAGWQRERLTAIAATTELPHRRALLWCYLAELLLEHCPAGLLLRYEDLVAAPEAGLARLVNGLQPPLPLRFATTAPQPGVPRGPSEVLAADDRAAIRACCAALAARLGYSL